MKTGKGATIFSWSLYDFANTIFAMNVTSFYFPLWVKETKGGGLIYILPFFISMLLVSISLPIMGVISDRYRRRIPFLAFFTLICIVFTGLMGTVNSLVLGLLFYAIANFCYQSGMVFYNALLPEISTEDEIGRVSGYGVSLGYVGTIAGLLMVWPFVNGLNIKIGLVHFQMEGGGYEAVFIPTAILFLIFSLPCFFFVKDKAPVAIKKFELGIGEAFRKLKNTLINIKKYPGLLPFLVAIFISLNAVNTVILSMAVYSREIIHFSKADVMRFFIISTIFAVFGSFIVGFVTDRFGPKRTLSFTLLGWVGTITLAALSVTRSTFWIVGPLAGLCLGATWVSARPLIVELAPAGKTGEFFGLAGLVGKSSAIFGPPIWGLIIWALGFSELAYRIATLFLAVLVFVGLVILQKVPETRKVR